MATRIRYSNTGLQLQSDDIVCDGKILHATIDTASLVYELHNGPSTIVKGQGSSLNDCKKLVKRDLKVLGASFSQEIRNRGNTKKL